PKVAMQIGNWAGQARRMARSLTSQMRDELDLNPHYGPPPTAKTYQRPGMDDLKPGSSAGADAAAEDPAREEPDTRSHADAGAATGEPADVPDPKSP
ncbi:MAG: hypothetical protein ACE5G3_08655, partial [Gammaproteobacteria bacterium]